MSKQKFYVEIPYELEDQIHNMDKWVSATFTKYEFGVDWGRTYDWLDEIMYTGWYYFWFYNEADYMLFRLRFGL